MDEEPDILSSGPEWQFRVRWPRPSRGRWIMILLVALLACLGGIIGLVLQVGHQDATITQLRQAAQNAQNPAAVNAAAAASLAVTAAPTVSGSATYRFPAAAGGSFSVVVVAVRPAPGSAAVTWLFVYGQHTTPGQRYGLLSDTCGGQYVAPSGLAEGTADSHGDLIIVAPNLDLNPQAPDVWIQLYRSADGTPIGGVQGPLTGTGAKTFTSGPPC